MVKKLPLQTGEYALVDDEDYERCRENIWYVYQSNSILYPATTVKGKTKHLARFICNCSENEEVIRTGEWFDCQKKNLKVVTSTQRARKRHGEKNTSSIYKGVTWVKRENKWRATIYLNGKNNYLGFFTDEWEAAQVYNKAAIKAWGEDAFVNIKDMPSSSVTVEKKPKLKHTRRERRTEGARGVIFHPSSSKKSPYIVRCRSEYLGRYETFEEAKQVYDQSAWDYWQEQAVLHYPENIAAYKEGAYRKEKAGK